MTTEVEYLRKQLKAKTHKLKKVTRQKEITERQLQEALLAKNDGVPDVDVMLPEDLGEFIADAARDHGVECADRREPFTSASWKLFRFRLAALVKRAT